MGASVAVLKGVKRPLQELTACAARAKSAPSDGQARHAATLRFSGAFLRGFSHAALRQTLNSGRRSLQSAVEMHRLRISL